MLFRVSVVCLCVMNVCKCSCCVCVLRCELGILFDVSVLSVLLSVEKVFLKFLSVVFLLVLSVMVWMFLRVLVSVVDGKMLCRCVLKCWVMEDVRSLLGMVW